MTEELLVSLSPEKVRQRLLEYFEANEDLEVRNLKPKSIHMQTMVWSEHPWIKIKIGILGEENRSKLTIDFGLQRVIALLSLITVVVMAFCWIIAVTMFEAIVIATIIGAGATIVFSSEINKVKKAILNDIRNALDLQSKTK
jgi:hypothetical protein